MWYLYLCDRKGQLYTGINTDLQHRMKQHGAKCVLFFMAKALLTLDFNSNG